MDITIRPACAADLPLLEWGGEFWHYREKFGEAYADQLAGRRLLLVADLNGYPVGRIALVFSGGNPLYANGRTRAYLYSLQVISFLQGLGIGNRREPTLGMTLWWVRYYSAFLRGMWWWILEPVAIIVLLLISLTLISIGLDEIANPRVRKRV